MHYHQILVKIPPALPNTHQAVEYCDFVTTLVFYSILVVLDCLVPGTNKAIPTLVVPVSQRPN